MAKHAQISSHLMVLLLTFTGLLFSIVETDSSEQRIIGGVVVRNGQAPYQVSLQTIPGRHLCGGSIVAKKFILSAGHCVSGWLPELLRVVSGTLNYRIPGAIHTVVAITVHEGYEESRYRNDLAVLHLDKPIAYNALTQPIPLSVEPLAIDGDTSDLLFTGWGSTELWAEPAEVLLALTVRHISQPECEAALAPFDDITVDADGSLLCAQAMREAGGCHGDSGGPLVKNGRLVGVLVWTYSCAAGIPDIFVGMLHHRDWVRQIILND